MMLTRRLRRAENEIVEMKKKQRNKQLKASGPGVRGVVATVETKMAETSVRACPIRKENSEENTRLKAAAASELLSLEPKFKISTRKSNALGNLNKEVICGLIS